MPITDKIHTVADARRYAKASTPDALFNFIDGGAEDEVTMAANAQAFDPIAFRPRAGVGLLTPRLETTVVGLPVSMPILTAPVGMVELIHPDGVRGVFRAVHAAGTIAALSASAGLPPEALANEPGPRMYQLYARDRDVATDLIDRAKAAGFDALIVTVDSPTVGRRGRDARSGAGAAMNLTWKNALRLAPQVARKPRWGLRMAKTSLTTLRSPDAMPGGGGHAGAHAARPSAPPPGELMRVSPFTWDDITWMRDQWSGPFLVKGVLSGTDANLAVDAGADAVIVSNHGGRQLEGAPATIRVLPEVVDAVGGRAEVLLDSGVRRGGDVVKALALGARAVLIGRPYCYGLAAAGEAGVGRVLEILREDVARTMALLGCSSVEDLDPSWLRMP